MKNLFAIIVLGVVTTVLAATSVQADSVAQPPLIHAKHKVKHHHHKKHHHPKS